MGVCGRHRHIATVAAVAMTLAVAEWQSGRVAGTVAAAVADWHCAATVCKLSSDTHTCLLCLYVCMCVCVCAERRLLASDMLCLSCLMTN